MVKVRGQCHGVKVRVMIGGHKVGQGRWSRSGYRSWGQVGGGVKVGGTGRGSRSGGQGLGVKVWGRVKVWRVKVGIKVVVKVGVMVRVKVVGSRSGS